MNAKSTQMTFLIWKWSLKPHKTWLYSSDNLKNHLETIIIGKKNQFQNKHYKK